MKRILLIANYRGPVGGISGQVSLLRDCLNNNVNVEYDADIFSTHGNVVKRLGLFFKLLWVVRKYDVLHIHGCSDWGMLPIVYGMIVGKIWGKRIIVTYHGGGADGYFEKHGAFARRWLKRADKVIVLNGYLEKVFAKYEIPCVVIPNIIELREAQKHSPYQWESPRLISVRHLRELYNIPCILQAFEIVKAKVPRATLTILGDGPLRGELEELVKERKLKDVKFIGQVKSSEMANYLAQSEIMLSAPHIDNMPVSVMEAMNAGVLVVSSNVGGVPYLIENGKNGLLFKDDDAEGMANCIMEAMENCKKSRAIITKAREDVKKYSWTHIRKMILQLYEE